MDRENRFLLCFTIVVCGMLGLLAQCFLVGYHLDRAYRLCQQAEIRNAETDKVQLARFRTEKAAPTKEGSVEVLK